MSIVCNTCSVVGHRTRECPTVVCHFCGHRGHVKSTCPEVVCRGCGRSGHFVASCQQARNQRQHEPASAEGHVNRSELREDPEELRGGDDGFFCDGCGARGHLRNACPRAARHSSSSSSTMVDGTHEQQDATPGESMTGGSTKRARTAHANDDEDEPRGVAALQSSIDLRQFFGGALPPEGREGTSASVGKCGCMSPSHSPANCPRLALHQQPFADTQHRCSHCGRGGHYAPHCPRLRDRCFHCATPGHLSTSCPLRALDLPLNATTAHADADATGGVSNGAGDGKRICYECHRPGHFASTCPQRRSCRNCKEVGHLQAHCPQSECRSCHQLGHYASVCPVVGSGGGQLSPSCSSTAMPSAGGQITKELPRESDGGNSADDTVHTPSSLGDVTISLPPGTSSNGDDDFTGSTSRKRSSLSPQLPPSSAGATVPFASTTLRQPIASASQPSSLATRNESGGRRVAVIIDGAYLERCIRRNAAPTSMPVSSPPATAHLIEPSVAAFYRSCKAALQHILHHIGTIFDMQPIAFWFALNPSAVYDYCAVNEDGATNCDNSAAALVVSSSNAATRTLHEVKLEVRLRSRHLLDAMASYPGLSHVVVRTAGFLAETRQSDDLCTATARSIAVERGVDVAIASSVMECFVDRDRYQQVVLLSGDAALSSVVQLCNASRRQGGAFAGQPPVRVCACSNDLSPVFLQNQDLSDFLPVIYLDAAEHEEPRRTAGTSVPFPAVSLFSRRAS